MMVPKVSVIMPTHNRAGFVGRAVASVLAQTESDFEFIIVNDASTDGTSELLSRLARQDGRIRVITNLQSMGGGGARNVGIEASSGQWIAFLDDDDEWVAGKLEIQLAKLDESPEAVACSCGYERHFSSGSYKVVNLPEAVNLEQLLRGSILGGASMCVCSRKVLKAISGFDANLLSGQDWDLWVRLREQGSITVCSEPLVRYNAHDGSRITNNMTSQYYGARRFYFKHRLKMSKPTRDLHIAYSCFIMSRQSKRSFLTRLKYLTLAIKYTPCQRGLSFAASSLPRILADKFNFNTFFD